MILYVSQQYNNTQRVAIEISEREKKKKHVKQSKYYKHKERK